ncbi:hypothetical protein HNQ80_002267 [Anaerosolibacter carboniphilus]|uniref:Uncharacterized protein n=1 Tax=Anaerosolibacter carboniphilus TaxID=1417629 RepID=A0A841KVD3_9FIRM|nr:hypothetical protein [Anaerosolibacter carboniphilus]MBB6216168.1 hypothetical protein [Anaerosolibacter carboniphilus]
MDVMGSKFKLSNNELTYLHSVLNNGALIQQKGDGLSAITADLQLIHLSLKAKLDKKIIKKQKSYVVQFNVYEILYIQTMLEFLIPYLNTRSAEYQVFLFDHRHNLSPQQFLEIKGVHQGIFSFYRSMCKLMDKINQLEPYYKKAFYEIMNMSLEERVNALLKIDEHLQKKQQEAANVIYIHTKV